MWQGGLAEQESVGSAGGLELNQGDITNGRISRVSVANIFDEALYYPELPARTTLEC